ncbi:hypothetical protein ACS0TY_001760 [Phlomoides rotata]
MANYDDVNGNSNLGRHSDETTDTYPTGLRSEAIHTWNLGKELGLTSSVPDEVMVRKFMEKKAQDTVESKLDLVDALVCRAVWGHDGAGWSWKGAAG